MKSRFGNFLDKLPLVYRLYGALMASLLLVFFGLWLYLWQYESHLLLAHAQKSLQIQADARSRQIMRYLDRLHRELRFLSHLEVMDDLVARDRDRRITRLLELKASDLGEEIDLLAIASDGTICAASRKAALHTDHALFRAIVLALKKGRDAFVYRSALILVRPLYASFDRTLFVGYLVLRYPLRHLERFTPEDRRVRMRIVPEETIAKLSSEPFFRPLAKKIRKEYLVASQRLHTPLEGWRVEYALHRSEALATLYHIQKLLLWAFAIALLLMLAVLWLSMGRILRPLERLAEVMGDVVRTGDYARRVDLHGFGEVDTLQQAFNHMLEETSRAMEALKVQKESHLEALKMLLTFFAAISDADSESGTIAASVAKIAAFAKANTRFSRLPHPQRLALPIERTDPETGRRTRIGYIVIAQPQGQWFSDRAFTAALARMISLQIDRINLLTHTRKTLEAKSTFFSALSHELRTPLGAILSLTQTMLPQTEEERMRENLVRIEDAAHRLLSTINDILDLAKAESGKMEVVRSRFDLKEAMDDVLSLLLPLAEEKSLQIETRYRSDSWIESDRKLCKHLFTNILDNAIKYTPTGTITIMIKKEEERWYVRIRDTGIGIAPEALAHLFDEFYRGVEEQDIQIVGSGLGLALSRRIAEILGGEITIESVVGEGTEVTITLPVS